MCTGHVKSSGYGKSSPGKGHGHRSASMERRSPAAASPSSSARRARSLEPSETPRPSGHAPVPSSKPKVRAVKRVVTPGQPAPPPSTPPPSAARVVVKPHKRKSPARAPSATQDVLGEAPTSTRSPPAAPVPAPAPAPAPAHTHGRREGELVECVCLARSPSLLHLPFLFCCRPHSDDGEASVRSICCPPPQRRVPRRRACAGAAHSVPHRQAGGGGTRPL